MTKIKLCGLFRMSDIEVVNELRPEYIGFVFSPQSKRFISPSQAIELKKMLRTEIKAVGVFVNERVEQVAKLLNDDFIDIAQLHGNEDETYISSLRKLSNKPIIKAFVIKKAEDIEKVKQSNADYVLLDSGAGTGAVFNWELIQKVERPYFLAGGLNADNVAEALNLHQPYAVDVSSGIESNGLKDKSKMKSFVAAVRKGEKND